MYYICYSTIDNDIFEVIYGEDAMQLRVSELCDEIDCSPEDIHVFNAEDEII